MYVLPKAIQNPKKPSYIISVSSSIRHICRVLSKES